MSANTNNTRVETNAGIQESANVQTEIAKIGVGGLAVTSGLIGLWAVACMVSGLIQSGGPLSFVKSWFGALMG